MHLPGLRRFVRLMLDEVKRLAEPPFVGDELHAVLLDEVAALHFGQHVQPLKHEVSAGNERFADVKPRKVLALEEADLVPLLGDQRAGGRAGGAAANDDDVGFGRWRVS